MVNAGVNVDYWNLASGGGFEQFQMENGFLKSKDAIFCFNNIDGLMDEVKSNIDNIAGVIIIPFMYERNMNNFKDVIEELVEYAIYDSPDQKLVNNIGIFTSVAEFVNIAKEIVASKKVYIDKIQDEWPEDRLFIRSGDLSSVKSSVSVDYNTHYWIEWEEKMEIEKYPLNSNPENPLYLDVVKASLIGHIEKKITSRIGGTVTGMDVGTGEVSMVYRCPPANYHQRID